MDSLIIQMFWKCRHCAHENPGLQGEDEGLRCKGCGSQRENEPWIMPNIHTAPAVTDPTLLRRARAGEVWHCGHCRHSERNENQQCSVCGAPRNSEQVPPKTEHKAPRAERKGRSPIPSAPATAPPTSASLRPVDFKRPLWPWALGAASLFCLVWLGFWLFGTHEAVAVVGSIEWDRSAAIEERHIKDGAGWISDRPSDAFNSQCASRFKRNRDCNPYQCHPHPENYTCNCRGGDRYACGSYTSCKPNNNGSASCRKVTNYCTHPRVCDTCTRTVYDTCYHQCPVYEDWCHYQYPQWDVIKRKATGGHDLKPVWPDLQPVGNDQRLQRTERYQVHLEYPEHVWLHEPHSETEFQRFPKGSSHKVEYTRAGTFKVLN